MFAPNQKLKGIPIGSMPTGFFATVSPVTLRQSAYREHPEFNSIWDMIVTPDERVFVAICAELSVSKSAKFCEFIPAKGEFIERFDVSRFFVYDDTWGLRTLGRLFHFYCNEEDAGVASSNLLSALALSPNEQTLAIGSADRLACVYLLQEIDTQPFNSHLND